MINLKSTTTPCKKITLKKEILKQSQIKGARKLNRKLDYACILLGGQLLSLFCLELGELNTTVAYD